MSAPSVDFLRSGKVPALGWLLLSAGALALVASVWVDRQWSQERAKAEANVRSQIEAQRQARQEDQRPLRATVDDRRTQYLARQLRQPWLPTLRLLENATGPDIFVVSLSMDPAAGLVRIDGECANFGQVLDYTRALNEARLLGPVELRSHEEAVDPNGRAVVRFSLVAPWSSE